MLSRYFQDVLVSFVGLVGQVGLVGLMGLLGLMGLMVPGGFDGKVEHPFLFCIRAGIKIFFFVPANPKITEGPLSGCSLLLTSLAWPTQKEQEQVGWGN